MTTFVLPIGYDTRRVTRPVVTHGVNATDTVVLVRPEDDADDDQSSRAIADVKEFLQEIEPGTTVTIERVGRTDFTQTILDCVDILAAASNPVVGLCGGPRDILLPLTVAAVVHADQLEHAYVFSDIDQTVQTWTLPPLTASVPDAAATTLQVVAEQGPCSLTELADQIAKSKSTVGRHLDVLENAGFVQSWMEGKHRHVDVTDAARVLAHASANSGFVDL